MRLHGISAAALITVILPAAAGAQVFKPVAPTRTMQTAPLSTIKVERLDMVLPDGNELTVAVNGPGRVTINNSNCIAKGSPLSAVCQRSVAKGSNALLVPYANNGYVFLGWAGACAGQPGRCTVSPKTATTVAAIFGTAVPVAKARVKVDIAEGVGSVKTPPFSEATIDCTRKADGSITGTCEAMFPVGAIVGLDAAAANGAGLKGWQGANGCSGYTCAFMVASDVALTARFTPATTGGNTVKLSVSSMRGMISRFALSTKPDLEFTCTPMTSPTGAQSWIETCIADVPKGYSIELSASLIVAGSAYYPQPIPIDNWAADCNTKTATTCTLQMNVPRSILIKW